MMRKYLLTLALLSLPINAIAATLKICFEDVPQRPWTFPDGSGLNLDLLRLAEKKLHEQFEFHSKPWKRCLEEVRSGQMDAVVGAAETAERSSYAVFPTRDDGQLNSRQALFEDSFDVFIRIGSDVQWNGSNLSFSSAKGVLVQRGYAIVDLLAKQGIVYSDTAASGQDALRQLSAGMFDVSILQSLDPKQLLLADAGLRKKIARFEPSYTVYPFFLMIGKTAYAREPKRIKAIWQTIGEVRASKKYQQMERAGLAK